MAVSGGGSDIFFEKVAEEVDYETQDLRVAVG